MRLLVLEPYYGGSHKAVLDCLLPAMDCGYDLVTMPARKWKWRMRGSAVPMAARVRELAGERARESRVSEDRRAWDAILASTFLDLAQFLGLAKGAVSGVPCVVYFHENQLVYPNRHSSDWDLQFPLTNITSALAADECWFNSEWNLGRFVEEAEPFIRRFPDELPVGVGARLRECSRVLPPPFDPASFDAARVSRSDRCRIVWPHRWEHDKDPETFFGVVGGLADEGLDFEVAIAGRAFEESRESFERAAARLGERLVHLGEPSDRAAYAELLASSDVAVSTARNEFFGLAMVEAAYAGAAPLVPDRLAYREIYPRELRYRDARDLMERLRGHIAHRPGPGQGRRIAERFRIDRLVGDYVSAFRSLAAGGGAS